MAGINNISAYAHSPVHKAIILKDHAKLKEIVAVLPKLSSPYEIKTEAASIAEDEKASAISAVVNRRDVPNGDTPLHLAAKIGDPVAAEMLMDAGANSSLKNKEGWSALREAIINKQDKVAMVMIKYSWNDVNEKWHRRLPRYIATMRRMRDFYMEITFHFESSVIPFISRVAPSDTYKIWKRGGNMRADMTLAGFDGLKIKRSDQSLFFLGDGLDDEREIKLPGLLCQVSHKKKEVKVSHLYAEPTKPNDRQVKQRLERKCKEKTVRVGIDVSQAVLVPQMTWRRKEKKEIVGPWKSKVYEMQNVVLSVKSKRPPGAPPPTEAKLTQKEEIKKKEDEKIDDILTAEERKQFEAAWNSSEENDLHHKDNNVMKEKKVRSSRHNREKEHHHKGKSTTNAMSSASSSTSQKDENGEKKVKAVRRLRELLTTKLPKETFPVKVAIPVVSTVRVLVTFTKFEEMQQADQFESAPSSPTGGSQEDPEVEQSSSSSSSSSWFQWIKASSPQSSSSDAESSSKIDDRQDPFTIPSDYKWYSMDQKS
ncbi:uncharacterized protein LOC130721949 isoform X2 [Lotus japonicus]|uniref:uncharacterized protein LOC130721949 isoform X2 n=1 Tax=Lotus japonicus TaxID=34305 RepID=UPI0025864605|nr:uncharacterized protein LOC130721949 isoform X2 [Lotus japonicus]